MKIYADEGISGTKTRNRREFLQMMKDAEKNLFDQVVVKDISRWARNTVDLLQSARQLKQWGIEILFINSNMTSMGDSEFVLTIFGAIAQEESANTSKRVKFGKKMNAENGRVPNITYGYDKIPGDYFNLNINPVEADIIRQIYTWYTKEGFGTLKIATMLNERGFKTKRGSKWSTNAISRILKNEIYVGRIVNGKEEVSDFLTGKRDKRDESQWITVDKPELRIIDDETFALAHEILRNRYDAFHMTHERQSNRHLFSTLIKCKECGWSFRRTVKTYKNTYIRWTCSAHNRGKDKCPNGITVDEDELIEILHDYFTKILSSKPQVKKELIRRFQQVYRAKDENELYEKQLKAEIEKLKRKRQKYMNLYEDDIISREELNNEVGGIRRELERKEQELEMVAIHLTKGEQLEALLDKTFQELEELVDVRQLTNAQLKQVIRKIEVDQDGNVDIYLRLLGELGLDKTIPVRDNQTQRYYREIISPQFTVIYTGT